MKTYCLIRHVMATVRDQVQKVKLLHKLLRLNGNRLSLFVLPDDPSVY